MDVVVLLELRRDEPRAHLVEGRLDSITARATGSGLLRLVSERSNSRLLNHRQVEGFPSVVLQCLHGPPLLAAGCRTLRSCRRVRDEVGAESPGGEKRDDDEPSSLHGSLTLPPQSVDVNLA
jgi:hypothetical protein